jgi:DNA repair photolyase
MEPRTSTPARRLAAIKDLSSAGIPTGVLVGPVIPGLTDHELIEIIGTAVDTGAMFARYITLRLPFGIKSIFEKWLKVNYPNKKDKVLNRIRSLRGGKLYDSNFYERMKGKGIFSEQIENLFKVACGKAGINTLKPHLTTDNFRKPTDKQLKMPF